MPSWTPASICRRLERDGHFDLLEAVRQREITAHHAGCIAGHRRPARRTAHRREEPARILCLQRSRLPDHDQLQDRRHLSAGRRSPALRRLVELHQGGFHLDLTGTSFGTGTTPAASSTSLPISPRSTSLPSIRRRHRRKRRHSGTSSAPTPRRKTPS